MYRLLFGESAAAHLPGVAAFAVATALLGLLAAFAELARRRIAPIHHPATELEREAWARATRWLSRAVGVMIGVAYGALVLPSVVADAYGPLLAGSASASRHLPFWVAGGFASGLALAAAGERRGLRRGSVLGLALAALGGGLGVMAFAGSIAWLYAAATLAGAGAGAVMIVLQPEFIRALRRQYAGPPTSVVLGRMNNYFITALCAVFLVAGLAAQAVVPEVAAAILAALALACGWALLPVIRVAGAPEVRLRWRELWSGAVRRSTLITALGYGALAPVEVKAASALDGYGLGPTVAGIVLAGALLPGAWLSAWWGRMIHARGLPTAERLAALLTVVGLVPWAVGLWLGGLLAAGGLIGTILMLETWTTLAFACAQTGAVGTGERVAPTAGMNLMRFGVARVLLALLAAWVWELELEMGADWRLWALAVPFGLAAFLVACAGGRANRAPEPRPAREADGPRTRAAAIFGRRIRRPDPSAQ